MKRGLNFTETITTLKDVYGSFPIASPHTATPSDKRFFMRKALPQMLDLSMVLMVYEAGAARSDAGITAANVCEKLRPKLSTLMGATGFRSLLCRALAVASAEVPALRELQVDPAGSLVGKKAAGHIDTQKEIAAGVVLIAQLLSLLVAFIGENLTIQILLEIWPQLLAHDPKFTTGDSE